MRKIVMVLGLAAVAATPLVATASVAPTAMNTMLLEDTTGAGPAPLKVAHKGEFIPFGIAGTGAFITALVFATKSGNSPG